MLKESVTSRDAYILAQALIFTIEILEKLPEDRRPSTIDDMKAILASVPRAIADAADMDINGLLVQVEWEPPDYFQEAADRLSVLVGHAEAGSDVVPLRAQAESELRSLLRHAEHEYQRNVAQTAVNAVVSYLKEGQFNERWRRHGVDMALIGLRGVGTIKPKRR
jgi:phosphoglycerate dehydrogenase-like enzyme